MQASAEQCGSDCTSSTKTIRCQTTASEIALARGFRLLVEQSVIYKTAVLTFKIRNTATPAYLNRHIQSRDCVRNLRSSGTPLLGRPSWKTNFAARGFRHSAPAVWNSLRKTVLDSSSLTVFSERELTFTFAICYRPSRPSVCLSVVCNARALYSGGSNFRQYFYGIRYLKLAIR